MSKGNAKNGKPEAAKVEGAKGGKPATAAAAKAQSKKVATGTNDKGREPEHQADALRLLAKAPNHTMRPCELKAAIGNGWNNPNMLLASMAKRGMVTKLPDRKGYKLVSKAN